MKAELRYNFIEMWREEFQRLVKLGALTKDDGRFFFEWCTDWDNLQQFIALYYDWAAEGFKNDAARPRVEPNIAHTKMEWVNHV